MSNVAASTEENPLLAAALAYAGRGWQIFPLYSVGADGRCTCGKRCSSPGKHPRTKHGLKDATTDSAKLRRWWGRWPSANIGIRTGDESGLIVLDRDDDKGGVGSLAALENEHGVPLATLKQRTGGGGAHYFFRHPANGRISSVNGLRPGIDRKADGGYVVAPPSRHFSGSQYEWEPGHAHGEIEMPVAPDWFCELARVPRNGESRAATTATPVKASARAADGTYAELYKAANRYASAARHQDSGNRNNGAFSLAGHLRAFSHEDTGETLIDADVIEFMRAWNAGNRPPLEDAELLRALKSAAVNGVPREAHVVRSPVRLDYAAPSAETIETWCTNLPEFRATWNLERPDLANEDGSVAWRSCDLAIASLMAVDPNGDCDDRLRPPGRVEQFDLIAGTIQAFHRKHASDEVDQERACQLPYLQWVIDKGFDVAKKRTASGPGLSGERCGESGLRYNVFKSVGAHTRWTVEVFCGEDHMDTLRVDLDDERKREGAARRIAERAHADDDIEIDAAVIADELMTAVRHARDGNSTPSHPDRVHYEATPHGLVHLNPTKDGPVPERLTNFVARIKSDTTYDDGAERWHIFEIEAELNGQHFSFEVPADKFAFMDWPCAHIGAGAVVLAGWSTKDHTRAAVQLLSPGTEKRTVYAHTGWRKVGEDWVYLHGAGAIGSNGTVAGIETVLSGRLQDYGLPAPPTGERLREVVRASLRFLDVAPDRVTYPLFAMVYRSVIGPSDLSGHVTGQTGERKTELVALCQRHFGPRMHAKNLPGSWSSTDNALEGQAFALAHTLFVIDDFVPEGGAAGAARLHAKAARVLRAQGNRAGRDRMRPDSTLRPTRYPRGLILSSGEEIPHGHSLRARTFIVEVEAGDVDLDELTAAQTFAEAGLHAEAMAGFVRWLAPQYARLHERQFPTEVAELRAELLVQGGHGRTCEMAASLLITLRLFTRFARETAAVTDTEAIELLAAGRNAIVGVARRQWAHHQDENPVRVFAALLRSALSSGRAYVCDLEEGREPRNAGLWGWERRIVSRERSTWNHAGAAECIGWVHGDSLYLDPNTAHRVAKAADSDGHFTIAAKTLAKRLVEANLVTTHERGRSTTKVTTADGRVRALQLSTNYLYPAQEPGHSGHSGHSGHETAGDAEDGDPCPSLSPEPRPALGQPGQPNGASSGRRPPPAPVPRSPRSSKG